MKKRTKFESLHNNVDGIEEELNENTLKKFSPKLHRELGLEFLLYLNRFMNAERPSDVHDCLDSAVPAESVIVMSVLAETMAEELIAVELEKLFDPLNSSEAESDESAG